MSRRIVGARASAFAAVVAASLFTASALGALRQAAALERHTGEPELAARWNRLADDLHASINRWFRDAASGLFRETPGGATFTEHAQCLAILSGAASACHAIGSGHYLRRRRGLRQIHAGAPAGRRSARKGN